ncbi:hypothetical protein O181_095425 [Austropuccinia psidii MF-1]|uniref:Secreted protein n=1 Tax=Austropuccinia psidii MF-1 TaxID=1389203 RepID=A0A9Q3PC13_9BASI|nr:hypothetical protein [Austropuccinia psidii MF-1]
MLNSFFLIAALAFSHSVSALATRNQTCDLQFQPVSSKIDPTQTSVWCKTKHKVSYKCTTSSCHVGRLSPKDGLRFEGCSTEESLDSVAYVWPTSFAVGKYGGSSVFVHAGKQAPDLTSKRTDINPADPIQCMWGNSSKEPNLVRPECDKCEPAQSK